MLLRDEDVFAYHELPRPGKLEVRTSKSCLTQRDLSLAYTPGVARPCLRIHEDPDAAYRFTGKGNLVAVVSNGTAVLGLGDIGPLAGKPVMEGKAVLFKRFADIDVFDIELDATDPDEIVRIVRALAPTFGGINLEDIKAPECFHIEEALRAQLDIPVFHDDQHGTAIISAAALLNALEIVGKRIDDVSVVFCGAGAAGIACAEMYVSLGVRRDRVLLVDTVGVVYQGRTQKMNPYKARFAADTDRRSLDDAMRGADVFVGVSAADQLTPAMLRSMAADPIVLAMANPDPEITWELAVETRPDVIMATGRSDYPNQVNNVLGFPSIFRGALDVRARAITEAMKVAAVRALAALAREDVPESVLKAYGLSHLAFGREYLIPKPFDPRVLQWVAPAVAKAAMDDGVARRPIADLGEYRASLERILGPSRQVMHLVVRKAQQQALRRLAFPEGEHETVLRAAHTIVEERIARPVLLGRPDEIRDRLQHLGIDPAAVDVLDVGHPADAPRYAKALFDLRARKGLTPAMAAQQVLDPVTQALLMVRLGEADGFLGGLGRAYPDTIRPAIQIVGLQPGASRVSAVHLLVLKERLFLFTDTMVNIEPTAEELADIACGAAAVARVFDLEPRVAMLSFSSFGSVRHPLAARVARAAEIVREREPGLAVDGEMHLDPAVVEEIARENYPHSRVAGDANVLVFPNLAAGNIGYKLVQRLGGADTIGPILIGMRSPVSVLQFGTTADEIVSLAAITAVVGRGPAQARGAAQLAADELFAAAQGAATGGSLHSVQGPT
jgi:malate dehydrogenase (oxaloacetate-decarboxylating)(NADP+)